MTFRTATLGRCPKQIKTPDLQVGTYSGEASWAVELNAAERIKREKKWQWFCAFDHRWAVGGAIIRTGYAGKSFVWVFDRRASKLIFDESVTVPRAMVKVDDSPIGPHLARLKGLKRGWTVERSGRHIAVLGRLGDLRFDLALEEQEPPFTAVCPIAGGFNVTRKSVGLRARGSFELNGVSGTLNGLGMLDHSHGSLERKTQWKWAIGAGKLPDGRFVGFNMIQEFNDDRENVIWLGDEQWFAPRASFEIQSDRWHVATSDGSIDLVLNIEGSRAEDLNLGLVASSYTQPMGTWTGTILGHTVDPLFGVAEDHHAIW